MTLWISTVVRNEADRHLTRMLDNAVAMGAKVLATDDNSEDSTAEILCDYGATVRLNDTIPFWEHEGLFRQDHLTWTDQYMQEGDWILALDADETLSSPGDVHQIIDNAEHVGQRAIKFPLYEFWTETQYRTDGYWFGMESPILYRWKPGGVVRNVPMGCGREPTYVTQLSPGDCYRAASGSPRCDWQHWGYVREADRVRKHKLYTERNGGHGHNSIHVNSIITTPELQTYVPPLA